MRSHVWLPLELSVSRSGLRLVHNGVVLLDNVPLAEWAPQPHWRLALIAMSDAVRPRGSKRTRLSAGLPSTVVD